MLSRGNVELIMLEVMHVYWVEGYFEGINRKIQIPTTEETFLALTKEKFETHEGCVEFAVGEGSEVLYRHHIVCVPNVVPFEDQYVTVGEYVLEA